MAKPTEDNELQRTLYNYLEKCGDNWDEYHDNPRIPHLIDYDEAVKVILSKFETLGYHKD